MSYRTKITHGSPSMRKIVTVAVATTIAGSSLFFSAAVVSADAPTCPPGWTDQSLKRGDDFADKNRQLFYLRTQHRR